MLSPKKSVQVQRALLLGGVFLALYFLLVFRPLAQRVEELDQPLLAGWDRLVNFNLESGALDGLESDRIEASLVKVQKRQALLEATARLIADRLQLEPLIRSKMEEPFQLIDFQNERQLRIEQVESLARQKKVELAKAVTAGFPEYVADQKQPGLLWAQLNVTHQVVLTAINSGVSSLRSVQLLPPQPYSVSTNAAPTLQELPLRIELVGSMGAVSRFLLSLPLRAAEVKALSLPEETAAKPALFIDRILLRKSPPSQPEEVQLDLRASGFVVATP